MAEPVIPTHRDSDKGSNDRDWTPERGLRSLALLREHQPAGWLRTLAAPLLSALITGGMMYVAVRVEVAEMAATQKAMLSQIADMRSDLGAIRTQGERIAGLEVAVFGGQSGRQSNVKDIKRSTR